MTNATATDTDTVAVPTVPAGQKRILLRMPNWLGDIVMAAPTVAAIRKARPDAELIAQARKPFLPLAALLPGVTRVVPTGRDRTPRDLLQSRRTLRALGAEAAVVFPRSTRAALAPRLAGIEQRVGYGAAGRKMLLTHRVTGWRPYRERHRSEWFGLLARAFGVEIDEPWLIDVPGAARAAAEELLGALGRHPERPLVVLEPGASYGPAKCWPAEHFGSLAARFLAEDVDVVTVGAEPSRGREAEIVRRAGDGVLRAVGRTPDLGVLVALLAAADLVISNDTGPMHIAAAVAAPTLALFGASDPVVSGPLGRGERRLIYEPEPCSPCFLRDCPIPGHPCLTKIGVERVYRAAREMM